MNRGLIVGFAIAFGAATSAAAQFVPPSFQDKEKAPNRVSPQRSAPAESTGNQNARRAAAIMGPQDVLDISVFQVPELTKTLEVSDTGTINFPLLGEITAAGKTPEELQRELTSKLAADYLQHPVVTVVVKESNSQRVTISGAIDKPGIYPIKGPTSLMQVIALAGGFKDESDSTILVLRQNGGTRMAARYDVSSIEEGRASDPLLQANDILVAGTSAIKKTYGAILKALPVAGLFAFF
jgi:polysaccharide export outer membrane protein